MPFIPQNEQLARLIEQMLGHPTVGDAFDTTLKMRTLEQANAQSIFKSLAASNPEAAAILLGQPDVAAALMQPPRMTPRKGEVAPSTAIGGAMEGYKPTPKKKTATPPNATAIAGRLAEWDHAAKQEGITLPIGWREKAATIFAEGKVPTAANLGIPEDVYTAILAGVNDTEDSFREKTYEVGARALGIDKLPAGSDRDWAEYSLRFSLEQQGWTPEARASQHQKTLNTMDKLIRSLERKIIQQEQDIEKTERESLNAKAIREREQERDLYLNGKATLENFVRALDAAVAKGDESALNTVTEAWAAIPKIPGNTPFMEVRGELMRAILTLGQVDDAERPAVASEIKNRVNRLTVLLQNYANSLQREITTESGRPENAVPAEATEDMDYGEDEDLDEDVDYILGEED